jgi:hypothetical protein
MMDWRILLFFGALIIVYAVIRLAFVLDAMFRIKRDESASKSPE